MLNNLFHVLGCLFFICWIMRYLKILFYDLKYTQVGWYCVICKSRLSMRYKLSDEKFRCNCTDILTEENKNARLRKIKNKIIPLYVHLRIPEWRIK